MTTCCRRSWSSGLVRSSLGSFFCKGGTLFAPLFRRLPPVRPALPALPALETCRGPGREPLGAAGNPGRGGDSALALPSSSCIVDGPDRAGLESDFPTTSSYLRCRARTLLWRDFFCIRSSLTSQVSVALSLALRWMSAFTEPFVCPPFLASEATCFSTWRICFCISSSGSRSSPERSPLTYMWYIRRISCGHTLWSGCSVIRLLRSYV
mmetsp:Transcript_17250/g.51709  ORF Transcript_17250/g.51709 Transcript_17250/m.51709 type:complete len:209 (-) Transcript_17250:3278-3904(-)